MLSTHLNVMTYNLNYNKLLLFGDSITEFLHQLFLLTSYEDTLTKQHFASRPIDIKSKDETGVGEELKSSASRTLASVNSFSLSAALLEFYSRRLEVVVRGYAGYTSDQAKLIFPRILDNEDGKVVLATVFFGTNDATLGKDAALAVPPERYQANIESIILSAMARNVKLILITPSLHAVKLWKKSLPAEKQKLDKYRDNRHTKKYADILTNLGERYSLPVINLFDIFTGYPGSYKTDLLFDGLHLGGKGYLILFNELVQAIELCYPDLAPQSLPLKLPSFEQLPKSTAEFTAELQGVLPQGQ